VKRLATILCAAATLLFLIPVSAYAMPVARTASVHSKCESDVCLESFHSPSDASGFDTFLMGANTRAFRGRFRLAGPTFEGYSQTSSWKAYGLGTGSFWGVEIPVHRGWYCVQAYNTSRRSIGRTCQFIP
jgi:hypothetical protein